MIATGDGWELRLGDCIEGMRALADDSVDVTITDPPYEAEAHTLQRRQHGRHNGEGGVEYRDVSSAPLAFAPITPEERYRAAAHIARVTKHCALVFCQVEAVVAWRDVLNEHGFPYRRCIPWTKPDAMPSLHGRWPGQAFEAIVLAVKSGARPCPIGGKAKRYDHVRTRGSIPAPHPTTKPLSLMLELMADFSEPGDLILDAFVGSGSTGLAALSLNRRFLGFELNRDYFDIACRRLRGDEAKPNPAQPSLFGGMP
jgi:site-specific DNA-methyltransferase (adenine-specific)